MASAVDDVATSCPATVTSCSEQCSAADLEVHDISKCTGKLDCSKICYDDLIGVLLLIVGLGGKQSGVFIGTPPRRRAVLVGISVWIGPP